MGRIEINKAGVIIEHAHRSDDKPALQEMLLAYRQWLGKAACFVDFDAEVNEQSISGALSGAVSGAPVDSTIIMTLDLV